MNDSDAGGNVTLRRVIAYNKPDGEVVARNDPAGRSCVFDGLPDLDGQRWISIGRMDVDTSGLLLLTNDNELANRLMHPSTGLEQEYAVRVGGEMDDLRKERLLSGIMLEDGLSSFLAITDAGVQKQHHWYRCSLIGNKFQEVRRLWAAAGLPVDRLMRIRFGSFSMPSTLRHGEWIELDETRITELEQLCRMPPKKHTGLYGRARRLSERQERASGSQRRPGGGYLRGRR